MAATINHTFERQINGYYCGPASVRVALSARGILRSQGELASSLGTTTDGTDSSNNVVNTLNAYLGAGTYEATFFPGQDATAEERDEFRRDVRKSVDAGFGVVCNVVGPIATNDGSFYRYDGGHYVCVVGYDDDDNVLVADINVREYWVTTAAMATWIAARGYASSTVSVAPPHSPPFSGAIFGVDLSDFDSDRGNSPATVRQYRAAGISFITHKSTEMGESQEFVHTKIGSMLNAAKDAGIPFIGAYVVPRSTASAEAQVAAHIRVLDQYVPWWRTFPGFFHQVDLEVWPYDDVPTSVANAIFSLLRTQTKQPVVMYASKGQYGNQNLATPRWNANYPSSAAQDYRSLYDAVGGNSGPGWVQYGTPTALPEIWQYSSSAIVAGQHTTDVNAFRGTEADFATRFGFGFVPNTDEEDDLTPEEKATLLADAAAARRYAYNASSIEFSLAEGKNEADCIFTWGPDVDKAFKQSLAPFWAKVNSPVDAKAFATALAPLLAPLLRPGITVAEVVAAVKQALKDGIK